jgi:chromosome segregation ATPase
MNERTQKIQRALDELEKTLAVLKNEIPALKKQVEEQLGLPEQVSEYRPKVTAAIASVENSLKDYQQRFDEAMMDIERWEDESPGRPGK